MRLKISSAPVTGTVMVVARATMSRKQISTRWNYLMGSLAAYAETAPVAR
jgi:hypothetical protein